MNVDVWALIREGSPVVLASFGPVLALGFGLALAFRFIPVGFRVIRIASSGFGGSWSTRRSGVRASFGAPAGMARVVSAARRGLREPGSGDGAVTSGFVRSYASGGSGRYVYEAKTYAGPSAGTASGSKYGRPSIPGRGSVNLHRSLRG